MIFSGSEDLKDGISPPAIEATVGFKKTVSFKEVLKENSDSSQDTNDVIVKYEEECKEKEDKEN